MSDGVRLHDGLVGHEGVDLHTGLDTARLVMPGKRCPNAEKEINRRAFRFGRRSQIKLVSVDRAAFGPRKTAESDKWSTCVILPKNVAGSLGVSRAAFNSCTPGSDRRKSRLSAVLTTKGYSRRCTVRVRYTSPGKTKRGSQRIASYANTKGPMDTGAYNMGMIGYISRNEAAVDNNPEWEDADKSTPLFTYRQGKKEMLCAADALDHIGDGSVFTIIISPEDEGADPAELARRAVLAIEKKLDVKDLRWVGATHHNTDHDHVHIMVAREYEGREEPLGIPAKYVKTGLRQDCEKILNDMIGMRSWEDELRSVRLCTTQKRFTREDREILKICRKGKSMESALLRKNPHSALLLKERMKALARWRIAVKTEDGKWTLDKQGEDRLRKLEFRTAFGIRNTDEYVMDDRNSGDYTATVLNAVRPDEDDDRVLLLVSEDDGTKHFREIHIDTDAGENIPQGRIDIRKAAQLMRASMGGKQR